MSIVPVILERYGNLEWRAAQSANRKTNTTDRNDPDWQIAYNEYMAKLELRQAALENLDEFIKRLDPNDLRFRWYTRSFRQFIKDKLAIAIDEKRLDDVLEQLAGEDWLKELGWE